MASSSSPSLSSFLSPVPHSHIYSRSILTHTQPSPFFGSSPPSHGLTLLHVDATPSVWSNLPLGAPVLVLAAVALAFAAQSWINALLGGERGLGAFLSDGTGFAKSGFKPRSGGDDATKPLGGPDPLPWLKLPALDYVDVAGQPPRMPKRRRRRPTTDFSTDGDEAAVISKLEALREQMKTEVERSNVAGAEQIERELMRVMKEEGYDFST